MFLWQYSRPQFGPRHLASSAPRNSFRAKSPEPTASEEFEHEAKLGPTTDARLYSGAGARWDSVQRSFEDGQARISLSDSWRSDDQNLIVGLNVTATDFESGKFRVRVSLSATPLPSVIAMIPIGRIVDESPENVFILAKLLNANPYSIDEVQIPCSWRSSDSDLLKRYVTQVQLALVEVMKSTDDDRPNRPLTPLERTRLLGCVDGR